MRKTDIIFNSENGEKQFQIASGYILETAVLFENEDIVALIQAKGRVDFYNLDDEFLASGEVPPVEDGKEVYQEVSCCVEGDSIILRFPVYEWIDNYPNCDGEHDRWDTKIIGYHTITFDRVNKSVN